MNIATKTCFDVAPVEEMDLVTPIKFIVRAAQDVHRRIVQATRQIEGTSRRAAGLRGYKPTVTVKRTHS